MLMLARQLFEKEVYVWSKLKHPNILELLGYSFCDDTGYPLLISEWMPHGTAWSYVQKNPDLSIHEMKSLVSTCRKDRYETRNQVTLGL